MIHTDLVKPIGALVRERATALEDKVAYWDAQKSVSYRNLAIQTGNLAGNLQAQGLVLGERVAIYLPNSVNWVISCFGISRAGLVSVPISYDSAPAEVAYRLTDADVKVVITTSDRAKVIEGLRGEVGDAIRIVVIDASPTYTLSFDSLISSPAVQPPLDADNIDNVAFIVYTSGTTGKPKGVQLSIRSMLWVVAACWVPIGGLGASDTVLSPLPLFHSYALNLSVLAILAAGASEYIMEKYSSQEVLRLLKTKQFTVLPGVPTMFHYILEAAKSESNFALDGMRVCISAGAILPAELNKGFEAKFGIKLLDGYGITETSTMVTMNAPYGGRVFGSCGVPVPGVMVRIVDPVARKDVEQGEEGELIVRGPNLMSGYHNKPKETESALRDGWYHTGDLARADKNGYLTITGRLKELIIRGGQNIAPAEIEDAVLRYPSVLDCAAVGVPHKHLGEVPAVFVVVRDGQKIVEEELLAFVHTQLSAYKVPTHVVLVDEIPRTGSGKVMRYKLKDSMAAGN